MEDPIRTGFHIEEAHWHYLVLHGPHCLTNQPRLPAPPPQVLRAPRCSCTATVTQDVCRPKNPALPDYSLKEFYHQAGPRTHLCLCPCLPHHLHFLQLLKKAAWLMDQPLWQVSASPSPVPLPHLLTLLLFIWPLSRARLLLCYAVSLGTTNQLCRFEPDMPGPPCPCADPSYPGGGGYPD